jgi:TolB-like protein
MKKKRFRRLMILLLFSVVFNSSTWAGEVVTKELKVWAKKMIEEEKAIKAPPLPNTVAVRYFQNKTGQSEFDPLQKGIPLLLITDLSNVKSLQVIERVKLQALVEEIGLGTSGLVEFDTAPRVGRLLGAKWLIGGDISRGSVGIQSNVLDVPGQKIIGQPMVKGDLPELFRLEKDLLFEIIKLLKIDVKREEEIELRRPCSLNLNALFALFRAIHESDRGNYEKAAEHYERALKEDPKICIAKSALEELQILGLIHVNKRSRGLLRSLRDRSSLTDQLTPEDPTKRTISPDRQPSKIPQ